MPSRFQALIGVFFIAIFVITAALSVWKQSPGWDDTAHLTAGIAQLQTGDPRLNADHPPLARLLAALPSLFIKVESIAADSPDAWKKAEIPYPSTSIFNTVQEHLLWPSRLTMLVLAVILGWLIYAWASQLFGLKHAWLPLALYSFCPPLLANAPLVTTDMAATTFIFAAFYTWWRYLGDPGLKRLTWVCLSVAAAFAVKYSAIILGPLFLLLGIIALFTSSILPFDFVRRLRIVFGGGLIIAIATVVGIDLAYNFDGVFLTPEDYLIRSQNLVYYVQTGAQQLYRFCPQWLPVPLPFYYVAGFLATLNILGQSGWASYFLGQAGYGGWPNFFLMLLLIKLPISTLILIGLGVTRAVSRLPREWWNVLFIALPPLFLIVMASSGKMQIGIRHILPSLPFMFLLAGYILRYPLQNWQSVGVGVLVALSAVSSLSIHPYYLMYFNFLAGGPEQGWRISIAGDDYGQGDADLKRWLQAREINELAYLRFGFGELLLQEAGIKTKAVPCNDTGELVAVHAGSLLITHKLEWNRCYAWMRLRKPDEKIGYNIFLYNSKDAQKNFAAQTAQRYLTEGLQQYDLGKYEKSIALNIQVLRIKPDNAEAYNTICAAYNQMRKWPDAIKACTKAIDLNPDYNLAKNNLAWATKHAAIERE